VVSPPVLEWLSELDLCKRITCRPADMQRNVSSGLLLAEICAKYFPRDIASHGTLGAFDRLTSPVFKRDSWAKLLRILEANRIILPEDCVEAAINGLPGAASALLSNLYIALARRRPGAGCPQVRTYNVPGGRCCGGERFMATNPGVPPVQPELPTATSWRLARSADTTHVAMNYRNSSMPPSPMRRYKSTGSIARNDRDSPLWALNLPWSERGEARMSQTWSDRIAANQQLMVRSRSTLPAVNSAHGMFCFVHGMRVLNPRGTMGLRYSSTMGSTSMSC